MGWVWWVALVFWRGAANKPPFKNLMETSICYFKNLRIFNFIITLLLYFCRQKILDVVSYQTPNAVPFFKITFALIDTFAKIAKTVVDKYFSISSKLD